MTQYITVGRLSALAQGRFSGEIHLDTNLAALGGLTIEVLAHGIALAHHTFVPGPQGGTQAFDFPFSGFPDVALPCRLRARVVEADSMLDCDIELNNLEDIWTQMMPFQVEVSEIKHNALILSVEGFVAEAPQFDLYDWGDLITSSISISDTRMVLPIPTSALDGAEHRLTIVHRQSGLPVRSKPISLRFDINNENSFEINDVIARVDRIEKALAARYAEAFNAVAAPLYRHIDTLILNQRGNFEREIVALRQLLGAPVQKTKQAPLPTKILLEFRDEITGYGIHPMEISPTGKKFRYVSAECGLLLPGIATAGAAHVHVQGLRRSSDSALDDAALIVNGHVIQAKLYRNPNSESWNIAGSFPESVLRQDRNLIELRFPKAVSAGDPSAMEASLGILYIAVSPITADRPTNEESAASDAPGGSDAS